MAHAGGDATGSVLMRSLVQCLAESPSITILSSTFVSDLVVRDGRVVGLRAFSEATGWTYFEAPQVVLATGGIGMAWQDTTNPVESTGDGLAMAARAGARLVDLEFVQFHPTALALEARNGSNLPLLTEAPAQSLSTNPGTDSCPRLILPAS